MNQSICGLRRDIAKIDGWSKDILRILVHSPDQLKVAWMKYFDYYETMPLLQFYK